MPLLDMANLLNSFRLMVCPGLVSTKKKEKNVEFLLEICQLYEAVHCLILCYRTQIQTILLQAQHSIQKVHGPCSAW